MNHTCTTCAAVRLPRRYARFAVHHRVDQGVEQCPRQLVPSPRIARIVDDLLLQRPRVRGAIDACPRASRPLGQCGVLDGVAERLHLEGAIGQRLRDVGEVRPVLTVIKRQRIGVDPRRRGNCRPAACALADVLGGGVVLGLWAVSVSDAVESAPGIPLPTWPGTVLPHAEAAQRINPEASRTTPARNIAARHGDLVRSSIPRRGGRLRVICPTGANSNLPPTTRVCRNRLR